MSAADYLKCHCQNCGNSIEFPSDGLGQSTNCPHCGQATVLKIDANTEPTQFFPARKSSGKFVTISIVALALVAGGIGVFSLRKPAATTGNSDRPQNPPRTTGETEATNSGAEPSTPAKPPAPKSITDLKTGAITFEKAKNGSLVYAVGIMRNESDHQRFGVNIELELTDARGNKAGTAKDYLAVLEPRQEWRFRALVLDSKATAASVSSIREE